MVLVSIDKEITTIIYEIITVLVSGVDADEYGFVVLEIIA